MAFYLPVPRYSGIQFQCCFLCRQPDKFSGLASETAWQILLLQPGSISAVVSLASLSAKVKCRDILSNNTDTDTDCISWVVSHTACFHYQKPNAEFLLESCYLTRAISQDGPQQAIIAGLLQCVNNCSMFFHVPTPHCVLIPWHCDNLLSTLSSTSWFYWLYKCLSGVYTAVKRSSGQVLTLFLLHPCADTHKCMWTHTMYKHVLT